MIGALLYLQFYSTKNWLHHRLRRLKQPKYLIGAIVGGLYFYFYFIRFFFFPPQRGPELPFASAAPETRALLEGVGVLLLLLVVLLMWVWPSKRAALTFTEAEVAFLFPAPITRRGLVHFRLLRSQLSIAFTALLFALISNRFRPGSLVLSAAGWWLVLSTLQLHRLGASFALTRLMDRGLSTWRRRLTILAVALGGVAVVLLWATRTLPAPDFSAGIGWEAVRDYAAQCLTSGPLPFLLYPFRLLVRPYHATDEWEFLLALGPALLLLGLHYLWVIRADVAFEEASLEASQKLAERRAAGRAGQHPSSAPRKARRPPFVLQPTGSPTVALLWKNLISAGQLFSLRVWLILLAMGVGACLGLGQVSVGRGVLPALGFGVAMMATWSVFFGPHVARMDFRQDLPQADILKSWPLRGWQVVLGETLAPAVILAGVQWLLISVALLLLAAEPTSGPFAGPLSLKVGVALSAAMLLPVLNVISLLLINAAVLAFPAWLQSGRESPQGIEATGQRLIYALGQLLAFTLAVSPVAGVFAAVLFVSHLAVSLAVALPLAAVVAAVLLALEAALGVILVGRLFERFDLSAESNS